MVPSYTHKSSLEAGSETIQTEVHKYTELSIAHTFTQQAIETLGVCGSKANALIAQVSWRILASVSGNPRCTSFLLQRVDVAIQTGVAPP